MHSDKKQVVLMFRKLLILAVFIGSQWSFAINKNCYISVETVSDGFGSQYQSVLSAIAIADYLGIEFVYTPMRDIAHNYNNDINFINRLIDFTGIRNFYKNANTVSGLTKKNVSVLSQIGKKPGILYVINSSKIIIDNNPDILFRAKSQLRKVYLSSSKPKLKTFDVNSYNVAVHIRRRNIMDDRESFLVNDYYFGVMNDILKKYPNALFHIYSQANSKICDYSSIVPHGFEGFEKYSCTFHLDEPVEDTFHGMVMADALIMCDSSLSYAAAILSNGEIYYHKFWHKPLPSWIIREEYVADF